MTTNTSPYFISDKYEMFDVQVEGRTGTANKETVTVYYEGQLQQAHEVSSYEIKSLSQEGNDFLEARPLHLVILGHSEIRLVGRYSKLVYLTTCNH